MSDEALFFEIGDARRRVVKGMIPRKVRRGVLEGVMWRDIKMRKRTKPKPRR